MFDYILANGMPINTTSSNTLVVMSGNLAYAGRRLFIGGAYSDMPYGSAIVLGTDYFDWVVKINGVVTYYRIKTAN